MYKNKKEKQYKVSIESGKSEVCSDKLIYFKKSSPIISNENYFSDKNGIYKLKGESYTLIYSSSKVEKIHLIMGDYIYFSEFVPRSSKGGAEYTALSRINLKTNIKEPLYSHICAGIGYFFNW